MKYNKLNFHKNTFCVFKEVALETLNSLKLSYKSKSGSDYYFTEKGIYRVSDHWGRAANCRWRLETSATKPNQIKRVGYADWTDFYPNNEQENLFYITLDINSGEVLFQHKNNPNFNNEVLRNAAETAKRIKQIKEIVETNDWAKYLKINNLEEIRNEICNQLISTTKTLNEIKQLYR